MSMQSKTAYAIISVLVAMLVISSTLATYYYTEFTSTNSSNAKLNSELAQASDKYSTLASRYNSVLSNYNGSVSSFENLASLYNSTSASFLALSTELNQSLSLLVLTVSNLNTSTPAYSEASKELSSLWDQYLSLTEQYGQVTSSFHATLQNFDDRNNITLNQNPESVPVSLLTSNIVIDYGNGTNIWLNSTSIKPGWNFYVATLVITNGNVNATWYPTFTPPEHLVSGIDGVMNNVSTNTYWFSWVYNSSSSWQVSQVGVDEIPMYNGSSYAWTYCQADANFNPTCTPP